MLAACVDVAKDLGGHTVDANLVHTKVVRRETVEFQYGTLFPITMTDRNYALRRSNTAYFITIIIVQWADLMICKTRVRSLFEQGITNVFMNWSLFFETALGAFLVYIPFAHDVTGTAPMDFVWWTPAVPFSLAIYAYDELRKGAIRKYPNGWLRWNTYW